jgi:hypothetical protein
LQALLSPFVLSARKDHIVARLSLAEIKSWRFPQGKRRGFDGVSGCLLRQTRTAMPLGGPWRCSPSAARGAFGIGYDSHIRIALGEELRRGEGGRRLHERGRNVLAAPGGSTGRSLFDAASHAGA